MPRSLLERVDLFVFQQDIFALGDLIAVDNLIAIDRAIAGYEFFARDALAARSVDLVKADLRTRLAVRVTSTGI